MAPQSIEERVAILERDNQLMRVEIAKLQKAQVVLPDTGVVSSDFWKRAFAIWGHLVVAQFIIGFAIFVLALVVSALLGT